MADPDAPQEREQIPIEIEVEPPALGRFAIWVERTRLMRARVEAARRRHASLDLGFAVAERDAAIGGGLLAGALAYRIFVLLLPVALLFVSGIGLYASAADKSPGKVAEDAGLQGLVASQVASTASGGARGVIFILMVPAVLYALAKLYRALAITHAIAWHGSGRGVRLTPRGVGALGGALLANLVAAEIVGWIRRQSEVGGATSLVVYLVLVGGAWLVVSLELPRRETRWIELLPGAFLVGGGFLLVNVFNVYVTTRLVEDHADTYGVLGIATALLFSLVLVGRLIVVSAELNAALDARRGSRLRS
jgi:membrane protein